MIIAVFTKNRTKDKWSLFSIAESMDIAKKRSKNAIKQAKEIGYDEADSIVQGYNSIHDIPKILDKAVPERLFLN